MYNIYTRNATVCLKGLDGKGGERRKKKRGNDANDVVKQTLGERANRLVRPASIHPNQCFLSSLLRSRRRRRSRVLLLIFTTPLSPYKSP